MANSEPATRVFNSSDRIMLNHYVCVQFRVGSTPTLALPAISAVLLNDTADQNVAPLSLTNIISDPFKRLTDFVNIDDRTKGHRSFAETVL